MDTQAKTVSLNDMEISNTAPFVLIAGPCQMESRDHALFMAEHLKEICEAISQPLIFKASFDKANRTSLSGARGIGFDKALDVFSEIKQQFDLPCLTDIHEIEQCAPMAEVIDILQIPAFLSRQTDLLVAAAKSGAIVNIKKGQFLAPWDMQNVTQKVAGSGNDRILLTERGVSFGYNTLVNDMRALPIMAQTGYPVVFDATHSVQQPGGQGTSSGGDRSFVPVLARAAISIGVAGVFIETHDKPDEALSDGPNMVPLHEMKALLEQLQAFDCLAKSIS